MTTQQPDFLNQFEEKMNRLTQVRRNIQQAIQFKEQFTNDLKNKLGEINEKLQQLSGLINELKNRADTLESQISTNTASVGDKDRQIERLQQLIQQCNREKDELGQQINQYREQTQRQLAEQQQRIDSYEAEIRDLTQQKEAAENQLKALQEDINNRGNQQQIAQAQQIQQLTEANQKQLQEQEQQLTQRINECEQKIAGLEQQLRDKENEHQQARQQLDQSQNQAQGQVTDLQRQIEQLNQMNQQLVNRLMAATEAINQATDDLVQLTESVPNVRTKQEVDALLNQITQQIEQSIENIGRAAQGQPQHSNGGVTQPTIRNNTIISINGNDIEFGQLKNKLEAKSKQVYINTKNANNKYKQTLDKLTNATSGEEVQYILNRNAIVFKNGTIMGGRKTKKNRKQKGGFTYKKSFRRRSITSRSNSGRNTKRSSR